MHSSEEQYDLIGSYLNGELEGEARLDFEQQMAGDAELQAEVQLQREVARAILDENAMRLEQEFAAIKAENHTHKSEPKRVKKVPISSIMLVAASVFLVATFSMLFYQNSSLLQPDTQKLFSEYYVPYEAYTTQRGSSEVENENRKKAWEAYDKKEFATAVPFFETALKENPTDSEGWFYLGNCYLSLEKPDQSIAALRKVYTEESLFTQQTQWYIALAYLQKGETDHALILFARIAELEGTYAESAKRIVNSLSGKE